MVRLTASIGQFSDKGLKASNQDSHGAVVPKQPQLATKGIAIAIADGISSSEVSHIASQTAVKGFLEDYYCTSETWSAKTSAQRVIQANNSWLFAQNHRNNEFRLNKDKGYVSTFSALILKSNTAHIFHVGDAQISRLKSGLRENSEVLTEPHRLSLSGNKSYLSRALGITQALDIDHAEVPLKVGDVFFLATDGVYEYVNEAFACSMVEEHQNNLNIAAQKIVEHAAQQGSEDNLTVQLVRIDALPLGLPGEFLKDIDDRPFPPALNARSTFDGYEIIRELHKSSRSQVVLALDLDTQQKVVIKSPSTEGRQNAEYLERFLMEEWIANRINNAHVLKTYRPDKPRSFCYLVSEYVDGQTLAQWMIDNPAPNLEEVRNIIEQVVVGLRAFHRQEMLHQDLRPNNIMIDASGTVKIIDFGSVFVSGIDESQVSPTPKAMPGTAQFLAPEYFLGEFGSKRSDLYSLACITYHMLSGRSPYGTAVAKALSRSAQHRLIYQSVLDPKKTLPAWVDLTLKKALQADPEKRYSQLSEFIQDLRKPNPKFVEQSQLPLIDRDPVRFWQWVSALLSAIIVILLLR